MEWYHPFQFISRDQLCFGLIRRSVNARMFAFRKEKSQPEYWEKGHLCFVGAGACATYNIGTAVAFMEFAPQIASRKTLCSSSGVLAGYTILGVHPTVEIIKGFLMNLEYWRDFFIGIFDPRCNPLELFRVEMNQALPEDAHKRARNRMFISMTRMPTVTHELFTDFQSRDELIEATLGSCCIVPISAKAPRIIRGIKYIDGAISCRKPIFDQNTIIVSPFSGSGNIKPKCIINLWSSTLYNPENVWRFAKILHPQQPKQNEELFRSGFEDGVRFILSEDLYACTECALLPNRPRRGDCSSCDRLFQSLANAKIPSDILQLFEELQTKYEIAAQSDPFKYSEFFRIVKIFLNLVCMPVIFCVITFTTVFKC